MTRRTGGRLAKLAALGHSGLIDLRPPVDRERLYAEHYGSADAFVMPTHAEGLGFTNIEAMGFGLPVISSTVGPIPEVVAEGATGRLVAPGDVRALTEAMLGFTADPPVARPRRRGPPCVLSSASRSSGSRTGSASSTRVRSRADAARVDDLLLLPAARRNRGPARPPASLSTCRRSAGRRPCSPPNGAYHRDPGLSVPPGKTTRTFSLELSRLGKHGLRAGGDDTRPAMPGPVRSLARDLARRFIYYPDGQIGWYPAAVSAGRRLAREGGFDAIYSSSAPITAHLVGRALHRSSGIPWIAEFRDPWSAWIAGHALHSCSGRGRAGALDRVRGIRRRDDIAELGEGALSAVGEGGDHDPERLRLRSSPSASSNLVIGFLGTYYPARRGPFGVWTAVARIADDRRSPPVRLRVVGDDQQGCTRSSERRGWIVARSDRVHAV